MQVSHKPSAVSVSFDEPNLVSAAGLLPVMTLARGRRAPRTRRQLAVGPDGQGCECRAEGRVSGGGDGRRRGQYRRYGRAAPRRDEAALQRLLRALDLGSFLRSFTFGHVRQLDAVASRFLGNLASRAPLLGTCGAEDFVSVDVDDTIIDVHDYSKVGSGYAYSGVRRLNALLAAVSTKDTTPVVLAQRLRKGAANSARGAKRRITDALSTLKRLQTGGRVLCRFDSAFYGHDSVAVALAGGAYVSLTMHMDPAVKRAIAGIPETAWETIENTDTVFDETTNSWVSKAEDAETVFTAFTSRKRPSRPPVAWSCAGSRN